MKAYLARQALRTPVQDTSSYAVEGTWTTGKVYDLLETGWRSTRFNVHPIPASQQS